MATMEGAASWDVQEFRASSGGAQDFRVSASGQNNEFRVLKHEGSSVTSNWLCELHHLFVLAEFCCCFVLFVK